MQRSNSISRPHSTDLAFGLAHGASEEQPSLIWSFLPDASQLGWGVVVAQRWGAGQHLRSVTSEKIPVAQD